MRSTPVSANTILYCRRWEETVAFYRDRLQLPVGFATDWFVEFHLSAAARLSIADQKRASIESGGGSGLTLTLEVEDLDAWRAHVVRAGVEATDIRRHPWNARVFYLRDPEGHRIEFWQPDPAATNTPQGREAGKVGTGSGG